MHHFSYQNHVLFAEDCNLKEIAKQVGTPFYCYSSATFAHHVDVLNDALSATKPLICYAVKANSNQAVLSLLAKKGCGADIVSQGELMRALAAGIPANKIVFSGVGKTDEEIAFALSKDILCFNIESEPELDRINAVALENDKKAHVSFRINPDVDAKTINRKIATGKKENKFGVDYDAALGLYQRADKMDGIIVSGIDMHIGSQITDFSSFDEAMGRLVDLAKQIIASGIALKHIDFGGGIGIPYHHDVSPPPTPKEFGVLMEKHMQGLDLDVLIEPGRLIAGNAGILVTEAIFHKQGDGKSFLIVDAAMNDLIRPTLYEAHHDIIPVDEPQDEEMMHNVDIVGPICESGDYLGENRSLPKVGRGDLIAVLTAGAYGAVQSGTYNTRPLVPEVMVHGDQFHVIRPRQEVEKIIALDSVPDWLK